MSNKNIIPIFFATDDNYIPFLDIALSSLIKNASKEFDYKIIILNTGLKEENQEKIKRLENENFNITFADISYAIKDIRDNLKNVFHFGLAAYYRLFIESLFPEYDKILYLDCDIVVLGDISKLYHIDMEGNNIAGVVEQFIVRTPEFRRYTKEALGIDAEDYINSGIMIMDLAKFREQKIQENFIKLISKYNFATIDPDQAYLNFLCKGKIKYLPVCWNREPIEELKCDNPNIIHYALYKKPWQYDDVYLGEYFWHYAKESVFYDEIIKIKESFDDSAKEKKEQANIEIKLKGVEIAESSCTFYSKLVLGV